MFLSVYFWIIGLHFSLNEIKPTLFSLFMFLDESEAVNICV